MNSDILNIIIIHFIVFLVVYIIQVKIDVTNNNYIYVWPLWGIGNRLRTIRVCYNIAKMTNRKICIIEQDDDGFRGSMKKMFNLPFKHISLSFFEKIICKLEEIPMIQFNEQCSYIGSVEDFKQYKSFCLKACEVKLKDIDSYDNSIYDLMKPKFSSKYKNMISKINETKAIGVHIRQGNVNDWHRGYFFGDEWKDISIKQPTSAPQFCCFRDSSKNLSACPSNIQYIEVYIEKMKTFPENTIFFICTDRPGCSLYLHQMFPSRIIMNEIDVENIRVDTYKGWNDFYCLASCSSIIVTNISSFSDEASRVHNIPILEIKN